MTLPPILTNHPLAKYMDPILLGDKILHQLNDINQINWSNLGQLLGTGNRGASNLYKTELMIHLSHLATTNPDMSRQQMAAIMQVSKDNLNRLFPRFNLPNRFSRLPRRINLKQMKKMTGMSNADIYALHKITFLHQIREYLHTVSNDAKKAAADSGLPYQKTRDWINQYRLTGLPVFPKTTKPTKVTETELETIESPQRHVMTLQSSVRIFGANGSVHRLKDLTNDTKLLEHNYLMYDLQGMQPVLGRIIRITPVRAPTHGLQTYGGNKLWLGSDSHVIRDQPEGLIPNAPELLKKKDGIISLRDFAMLGTQQPSIFSLLKPQQGEPQLEFLLDVGLTREIELHLKSQFGSKKAAAAAMGLDYRQKLVRKEGQPRLTFHHDTLKAIHRHCKRPDIHHPDFFNRVEKVRYATHGGRSIEVDHLRLEDDLLYLMGLIASDGYGSEKRAANLGFNNQVLKLVEEFKRIVTGYFPSLTVSIRPMTDDRSTYDLSINHYAIRQIMYNLQIKGNRQLFDEKNAYLPVFAFPPALIEAFLQGLFDGDGTVDEKGSKIGIAVFHPERVKNVALLLKRIGIDCFIHYSKQDNLIPPGTTEPKQSKQWNIWVSGKKDILKFIELIGSRHPDKLKQLKKMKREMKKKQTLSSKYNRAPMLAASLFKKLRTAAGVPQASIHPTSVWDFENLRSRPSITRVKMFYDRLLQVATIPSCPEKTLLQMLLQPNYSMDRVKEIEQSKTRKMYVVETEHALVGDIGIIID